MATRSTGFMVTLQVRNVLHPVQKMIHLSYVPPKRKKAQWVYFGHRSQKISAYFGRGEKKAYSTEFGRGGIKRIFTIPFSERPKIRRRKYSQNLLDCWPNDARYAFLRPGQIQLTNFRAGGRIKDIKVVL